MLSYLLSTFNACAYERLHCAGVGLGLAVALGTSNTLETLTVNYYFHMLFRIALHLKVSQSSMLQTDVQLPTQRVLQTDVQLPTQRMCALKNTLIVVLHSVTTQ